SRSYQYWYWSVPNYCLPLKWSRQPSRTWPHQCRKSCCKESEHAMEQNGQKPTAKGLTQNFREPPFPGSRLCITSGEHALPFIPDSRTTIAGARITTLVADLDGLTSNPNRRILRLNANPR